MAHTKPCLPIKTKIPPVWANIVRSPFTAPRRPQQNPNRTKAFLREEGGPLAVEGAHGRSATTLIICPRSPSVSLSLDSSLPEGALRPNRALIERRGEHSSLAFHCSSSPPNRNITHTILAFPAQKQFL